MLTKPVISMKLWSCFIKPDIISYQSLKSDVGYLTLRVVHHLESALISTSDVGYSFPIVGGMANNKLQILGILGK